MATRRTDPHARHNPTNDIRRLRRNYNEMAADRDAWIGNHADACTVIASLRDEIASLKKETDELHATHRKTLDDSRAETEAVCLALTTVLEKLASTYGAIVEARFADGDATRVNSAIVRAMECLDDAVGHSISKDAGAILDRSASIRELRKTMFSWGRLAVGGVLATAYLYSKVLKK